MKKTRSAAGPRLDVAHELNGKDRFKTILLFGGPGSGKGTQGAILKSIPGFYHFSTGEIFRRLDSSSEMGRTFLEYSSRGELVPDELVIQIWAANINAYAVVGDFKPRQDLLILDGIPRTLAQARILENYLDVLRVIHLRCDQIEPMVARLRKRALKEGRPDDADEKVIRNRFRVYDLETKPVLGYYAKDKVVDIDSMGSPARVASDVLAVLGPLQDQHHAAVKA